MNKASFDKLTTVTKDRLTYFFFILLSFILVNNFSLGIVEFNYPILDDIQLYKKIISGSFIFHDGFFF